MTQKNKGQIAIAAESAPQENTDVDHINWLEGDQQELSKIISFPSGYLFPKDNINSVVNSICLEAKEYIDDIKNLSKTALRKKYPLTYNRWRNMKQRKKKGAIIHQDFDDFGDFLRIMGPCEKKTTHWIG